MKKTLQLNERSIKRPTEGEWFEVNPLFINQELFQTQRVNYSQEKTRQSILEAFMEMQKKPEKYSKPFQTMIPEKKWHSKTVDELKELATTLGDHMADRIEQALEWAQRINNGEAWETICNKTDTVNFYRLVAWEKNYACMVGGAYKYNDMNYAPTDVFHGVYISDNIITCAVPLIVRYK